jgi:hypothetical protein
MMRLVRVACLGIAVAALGSCSDVSVNPNAVTINWRINNCKDTGMNFCGNHVPQNISTTEETCADSMASGITFTIVSHNGGGSTKMVQKSCPSGQATGSASVDLPDGTGPFDISATLDGVPASRSAHGCGLDKASLEGNTLRIYYAGCGDPNCDGC